MTSIRWDAEIAEVYDETYGAMFQAPVLGPMVDLLAELAGDGPALEFAIGTGRVALPLSARGIPVRGIELSPAMAERLSAVAEVIVPQLRRVPPGDTARVFTLDPDHST